MADSSIAAQIRARFQQLREQKADAARVDEQPVPNGHVGGSSPPVRSIETPTPPATDTGGADTDKGGEKNESNSKIAEPAAKSMLRSARTHQAGDILRRVPPASAEAEQSVLGAILLENSAIEEALRLLDWRDFYRERHALIYTAMVDLYRAGTAIDAVTLTHDLKTRGHLENVGGAAYIAELAGFVPSASNVAHYAKIVKEMAGKRELAGIFTELASEAYNGVTLPALIGEAERRLDPLLKQDTGETKVVLPEIFVRKTVEVLNWEQLGERRRAHVQNWVVQGWLARGELSLWSGKVEHGKTTVLRELILCALRGEDFLGRPTVKSKVFFAMLDGDGENLTYDELEKMGLTARDTHDLDMMFEPNLAQMASGPEQLFQHLWKTRPDLVIIDPFARLRQIGDFNDYNNTYLMGMLSEYCKRLDAHFALSGHIPRGRPAGAVAATAAFGSIAFGGGVNARFVVERKEGTDIHVLRTSKGKSAGFEAFEGDMVIERDPYTNRLSLGRNFSFKDQASAVQETVFRFLQAAAPEEEFRPASIAKELGLQGLTPSVVRMAGNLLFEAGRIGRVGKGTKASPYTYKKGVPTVKTEAPDSSVELNRWWSK